MTASQKKLYGAVLSGYQEMSNGGMTPSRGQDAEKLAKAVATTVSKTEISVDAIVMTVEDHIRGRYGRSNQDGLFEPTRTLPMTGEFLQRCKDNQAKLNPEKSILAFGLDGGLCGDWRTADGAAVMRTSYILGAHSHGDDPFKVLSELARHAQREQVDAITVFEAGRFFGNVTDHPAKIAKLTNSYRRMKSGMSTPEEARAEVQIICAKPKQNEEEGMTKMSAESILRSLQTLSAGVMD